jgi:hypothetical protein
MEAICFSETSVHTRSTRRHIPEDGILHSHRRENLNLTFLKKVYRVIMDLAKQFYAAIPKALHGALCMRSSQFVLSVLS